MPLTLKRLLVNNLINIFIFTIPIIALITLFALLQKYIIVCILIVGLIITLLMLMPYLIMSFYALIDLKNSDKIFLKQVEIESVSDWAKYSRISLKKSYIFDLFRKDYIHVFNLYFYDNLNLKVATLYIKESELKKLNFYRYFDFFYSFKERNIVKKQEKLYMDICYYKKSGIVKSICFKNNK